MTIERWNDGRLDDLQTEVRALRENLNKLSSTVNEVGILAIQIKNLNRQLEMLNGEMQEISGSPVSERRTDRRSLYVAITSGCITGGFITIIDLVTRAHT